MTRFWTPCFSGVLKRPHFWDARFFGLGRSDRIVRSEQIEHLGWDGRDAMDEKPTHQAGLGNAKLCRCKARMYAEGRQRNKRRDRNEMRNSAGAKQK